MKILRRDFITLLGGATTVPSLLRPLPARGQQQPVVGFINTGSREAGAERSAAFRKGLGESGYVEDQNVTVEHHWLEGQSERISSVVADLVRRRVAVIATFGNAETLAAKAATATIPIVFGVAEDPVRLGLVASLARPSGNATGVNFFSAEIPLMANAMEALRQDVHEEATDDCAQLRAVSFRHKGLGLVRIAARLYQPERPLPTLA
jgi:putative ABC transport system substrate-binding protein